MTKPETRQQFQSDLGDPRHGTINGYSNLRCRCPKCRSAQAACMAQQRAAKAGHPIPAHVHGTANGWNYYQCRCDACRIAHNASNRAHYAARYSAAAKGSTYRILCKRGHQLTDDNVYRHRDGSRVQCKECCRMRNRRRRAIK